MLFVCFLMENEGAMQMPDQKEELQNSAINQKDRFCDSVFGLQSMFISIAYTGICSRPPPLQLKIGAFVYAPK